MNQYFRFVRRQILQQCLFIGYIQKLIKTEIFVICKVLTKFMKILSHEYLEPYGKRAITVSQSHLSATNNDLTNYITWQLSTGGRRVLHQLEFLDAIMC